MRVSVIVCTRNRSDTISPCLESIAAAVSSAAPIEAEVIIVDNGSTDGTPGVIAAWANKQTFPVSLILEARKGLSVARNCALRAAQGDLIAFTDDDCRLSSQYINDLLQHDAKDTGLVLRGGRVDLGDLNDLPLTIKIGTSEQRWQRSTASVRHQNLGDSLLGCNLTMRKELVQVIGYFDERLGAGSKIPGGEDIDYIYRAYRSGVTIAYVPNMAVTHMHGRKTPEDGWMLFRSYAFGAGALYAKYLFQYPSFCRPLYWDFRNAVKEIMISANTFMPSIGFSHQDKVLYSLLGAGKYVLVLLHEFFEIQERQGKNRLQKMMKGKSVTSSALHGVVPRALTHPELHPEEQSQAHAAGRFAP